MAQHLLFVWQEEIPLPKVNNLFIADKALRLALAGRTLQKQYYLIKKKLS